MPRKPTTALTCASCAAAMWKGRTSAPQGVAKCQACRRRENNWFRARALGVCEKCDRPAQGRGLCRTHYSQWWRAGNLERNRKNDREWKRRNATANRGTCGWCGGTHGTNAAGTTMDSEGLTHAQWVRHHLPSTSRELVRFIPTPVPRAPLALKTPSRRGGVFYQGPCANCAEDFVGWSTFAPTLYCSRRCARIVASAKRGGKHFATDRARQDIYVRDGYICQICLEPTDPDSSPSSDWYPSLDHIVPRSLGGSHEPENLRCAHRWCNAVRGDLKYFNEGDLIPTEREQEASWVAA